MEALGRPMRMVGGVLSTLKVVLFPDPGARLPAVSLAVPGPMEMPNEPSPVMPLRLTVRVVLEPDTLIMLAEAVPVGFRVILAGARVLELKFKSV